MNKEATPEAYVGTREIPDSIEPQCSVEVEQLNRSCSDLSLKSELLSTITEKFERFDHDMKSISKEVLEQNKQVKFEKF